MLNFLTPPTDNLYKFIAITGLLFIFASVFYPTFLNIQINERILESEKDSEIVTIEMTKLERESKDIERKIDDMQKQLKDFKQNPNKSSAKQLEANIKDTDQLQKQTKEFMNIATELQKKNIEIEYKNKLTKFYNDYLKSALNYAKVGIIIGMILTIFGFTFWLFRVQKYQDLVLLKEAQQNQNGAKINKQTLSSKNSLKAKVQLTEQEKDKSTEDLVKVGSAVDSENLFSKKVHGNNSQAAEERFARHIGAVNSGNPRSGDNEQIDADLAKEYGKDL